MERRRRRFGFRWTPRGKAEKVSWFDSRDERDEHYRRLKQVGYAPRKVSGRLSDEPTNR